MAVLMTKHEYELLKAVKKGYIITVKKLINSNLKNLNDERYLDYQLIIEALIRFQIDIAKLLINKGFRVYKMSQDEKTILEYAVYLEDIDLITSLLAKGASPDILVSNKQNKTPFHLAIDRNQPLIIKLFLSQFDIKTYDKSDLLYYAIKQNKIEVVIQMIEKGFSLKTKNEKNLTPFCVALINKNYNIVDYLLSSHHIVEGMNFNNYDDIAPAYIASMNGHLEVIKKFISSGLSINKPLKSTTDIWSCLENCSGLTLLQCAVKFTKIKVVKFLISKGADILIHNENELSALHIAFKIKARGIWKTWQEFNDNNSIIDLLLKANMKFKYNPVEKHRLSHFHIACCRDEPKIIEYFLKFGAFINQPVSPECYLYKSFTPLHFAVKFRCSKTLELLLKNGADVKQKDFEGMTALHIAAKEAYLDGVRLLLHYGAYITSIDCHGNSPVHWAFEKKNYKIIDLLLSVHNVANSNPINIEGLSHFHIACSRNNVNVVKSFIENGVSIDTCVLKHDKGTDSNVENWSGYSPLHFAVSHNRSKIVQLLLYKGANVALKDKNGFTPLHITYRYTNEMFREFVKNILDDLGRNEKLMQQLEPHTDIFKVHQDQSVEFRGFIRKINWLPNRKDHFKIINSLLSYNSYIDCSDNHGNTPVLYAYAVVSNVEHILENNLKCSVSLWSQIIDSFSEEVYKRRDLILNNLLKLHVNLDQCYKYGSILNCVFWIHDKELEKMFELFLKNGANANIINDMEIAPLHQAILILNKKLISILLNYNANVDGIHKDAIPLLIATSTSMPFTICIDVIKLLIDGGANVNARQANGRTALHNLASRRIIYNQTALNAVFMLTNAGADINSKDLMGLTPLHIACLKENYDIMRVLLDSGADINIEDNQKRTVPCLLYQHLKKSKNFSRSYIHSLISLLKNYIISMQVVGLTVSKKALSSQVQCNKLVIHLDQSKLINKWKSEVEKLKGKKINSNCTLYNVLFKDENSLSKLVKNYTFKYIVRLKTFKYMYPTYGYLIQLKYQAGLERANLLPIAKYALNSLANRHLPDVCSEHICCYFTNIELKESIATLSCFLNNNVKSLDDTVELRTRNWNKRQKVNRLIQ
ncbi:ankyrin-3-like [Phymastichus coffea]|uniref:ankyrin-3-like n=1 Tax=Phymastichus coffea TaxID=108790 RepID=UPI00273B36E0|nr:ankyrin-3-like [Phymastichus coffea]